MLTYAQLASFYTPEEVVRLPKGILVEYLQHELLDSLYKQKGSELLSFMGGTAIRIGHGGTRFSEDLDFDNFGLSYERFQALLEDVVKDMKLKGCRVEFRFVRKGAYHCYIRFPDLLHREHLSEHTDEKILVRIDVTEKEKLFQPLVYTINRFDIYREILLNPADIILSQKLIAILWRKREKGRDFFDVSFLYGITQPNWRYIETFLGTTRETFQQAILRRCEKLDFKALASDVEPFLQKPGQRSRVGGFQRFIQQAFGMTRP